MFFHGRVYIVCLSAYVAWLESRLYVGVLLTWPPLCTIHPNLIPLHPTNNLGLQSPARLGKRHLNKQCFITLRLLVSWLGTREQKPPRLAPLLPQHPTLYPLHLLLSIDMYVYTQIAYISHSIYIPWIWLRIFVHFILVSFH